MTRTERIAWRLAEVTVLAGIAGFAAYGWVREAVACGVSYGGGRLLASLVNAYERRVRGLRGDVSTRVPGSEGHR